MIEFLYKLFVSCCLFTTTFVLLIITISMIYRNYTMWMYGTCNKKKCCPKNDNDSKEII